VLGATVALSSIASSSFFNNLHPVILGNARLWAIARQSYHAHNNSRPRSIGTILIHLLAKDSI